MEPDVKARLRKMRPDITQRACIAQHDDVFSVRSRCQWLITTLDVAAAMLHHDGIKRLGNPHGGCFRTAEPARVQSFPRIRCGTQRIVEDDPARQFLLPATACVSSGVARVFFPFTKGRPSVWLASHMRRYFSWT